MFDRILDTPQNIFWRTEIGKMNNIWFKVFKNGRSKIRGKQPLKNLKWYGLPKESSTNFAWSILEYLDPFGHSSVILWVNFDKCKNIAKNTTLMAKTDYTREHFQWKVLSSIINPLSANPTKWSNTLKLFVGNTRQIVLSVFDHFVGLALKGLNSHF